MIFSNPLVLAGLAILLALVILHTMEGRKKIPANANLPPGPPGYPVLGNLLSIPPTHSWLQFYSWAKKYGPMYRLNIAGRENFIVSSEKIANDLLRDRGNNYSSREQLPGAAVLLSNNLRPFFWLYGEKPTAAATYEPTQVLESIRMLRDLISKPDEYEEWFMRYSSRVIFRIGFGKVISKENRMMKRIFGVVHTVERVASPGAYLVDTFPALMYLPDWIAPFKRELKGLHTEELDVMRTLLKDMRVAMEKENAAECWEKMYPDRQDQYRLTEDEGAYVVGTLFEAGAGTTAAAMMSLLLALILHPEEPKELHAEIDEVVGESRLPGFDDMPRLPRVRAVVKEVLRWRPVTAGGITHMSTSDDTYDVDGQKYFIPAGTNIHPNQWAIHRDETLYREPESFRPE